MTRTSGVLLHFTSLPSAYGVGDLGPEAYRFAHWLKDAGQSHWQVLPINPTGPGLGNSPYSGYSAFAGNTLLVSPDVLVDMGYLDYAETEAYRLTPGAEVDYEVVTEARRSLLTRVFARHEAKLEHDDGFRNFCADNAAWLNDFAIFAALKDRFGGRPWTRWPEEIRLRTQSGLHQWGTKLAREIQAEKFRQQLFFIQWGRLRGHLRGLGIELIGDAPIYLTLDSADVWANQQLFKLDEDGRPSYVAGVPPDYFSEIGQRWGNPVFNWEANRAEGFRWWIHRLEHNFGLFDRVRLDHFRGFARYWEIPAAMPTAMRGEWVPAPGRELFDELARRRGGALPIIAEDLGVITQDVLDLKRGLGLPGMKIVQFAFGEGMGHNSDAPHNHEPDCVAYTGTHDNNTVLGWFREEADEDVRERLSRYLGLPEGRIVTEAEVAPGMVRLTMASAARTAIFPMQDLLGLDASARMNTPGTANGNWRWRLLPGQASEDLGEALKDHAFFYGRDGIPSKPDNYEENSGLRPDEPDPKDLAELMAALREA